MALSAVALFGFLSRFRQAGHRQAMRRSRRTWSSVVINFVDAGLNLFLLQRIAWRWSACLNLSDKPELKVSRGLEHLGVWFI